MRTRRAKMYSQSRFHTHNWCTRVHVVYQSTLPVSILDYQLEQQYRSIYQLLSYAYYSRVVCILLLEYYPYAYEFVIIEYCSTSSQYAYAIIILCIREYIILYYSSQQLCIVRLIKLEHFFCRTKYSSTSSYVLPSHDAYQLVLLFYAYYQLVCILGIPTCIHALVCIEQQIYPYCMLCIATSQQLIIFRESLNGARNLPRRLVVTILSITMGIRLITWAFPNPLSSRDCNSAPRRYLGSLKIIQPTISH